MNDTIRTDWAVRLRFCAPCRDEKYAQSFLGQNTNQPARISFISGSSLMTKYPLSNGPNSHDREEIYHFLYLTIPATGSLAYSENQVANGVYSYFFRPEAESALAFLEDTWRREDYSRFRAFFDRGRARGQRMRTVRYTPFARVISSLPGMTQEGRILHSWSSNKVFLEKEQRSKVKVDRSQEYVLFPSGSTTPSFDSDKWNA